MLGSYGFAWLSTPVVIENNGFDTTVVNRDEGIPVIKPRLQIQGLSSLHKE